MSDQNNEAEADQIDQKLYDLFVDHFGGEDTTAQREAIIKGILKQRDVLLAACKAALEWERGRNFTIPLRRQLRVAIAKAEGRAS